MIFAVGLLLALLIIYIHRGVGEPVPAAKPDMSTNTMSISCFSLLDIFRPQMLRITLIGDLLGVGAHGGYYTLMTWLSMYLKAERYLSVLGTDSYLTVIILASWYDCMASAQLLGIFDRRGNILLFSCCCVVIVLVYLLVPLSNGTVLTLGFPLGFSAAGILASMGALFNELYPQGVRDTGVGFCYNFSRIVSITFPVLVGKTNTFMSLDTTTGVDAAIACSIVATTVLMLPETKGCDLAAVMV